MFRSYLWSRSAAVCAFLYAAWPLPGGTQSATECVSADPTGALSNVYGDIELTVDPQDSYGRVLLTANLQNGPASVIVARLDARTGLLANANDVVTVAKNYTGQSRYNGPEWFQRPNGQLGILYAGKNGVHAAFRAVRPSESGWGRFVFDVNGKMIFSQLPPALANTNPGGYPNAAPPFLGSVYGQFFGDCTDSSCIGYIDSKVATKMGPALAQYGLDGWHGPLNPNRDGYFFVGACHTDGQNCGLYEAAIKYDGGLLEGSLNRLASANSDRVHSMFAGRHPVTGHTLIFALDVIGGNTAVRVWRQLASGGDVVELGHIPVEDQADHFRAVNDNVQTLFLYQATGVGTYVVPITAQGTSLAIGKKNLVSNVTFSEEIVWLPIPNKWAFYYNYASSEPMTYVGLTRCWFVP